jgi:hypothetical protein
MCTKDGDTHHQSRSKKADEDHAEEEAGNDVVAPAVPVDTQRSKQARGNHGNISQQNPACISLNIPCDQHPLELHSATFAAVHSQLLLIRVWDTQLHNAQVNTY